MPRALDFPAHNCAILSNSGTAVFRRVSVTHNAAFTALAKEPDLHRERLVGAQHALVGLIEVMDPEGDRVPLALRERL